MGTLKGWLALAGLMAAGAAEASALVSPPAGARVVGEQLPRVATGQWAGGTWTAASKIIGMTPTGNVPLPGTGGGGRPRFMPTADKSGVVALIMDYGAAGAFICSGSLLSDRVSILTAGHCVSDGFGTAGPLRTTAWVFTGDPDARTPFNPEARAIPISRIVVNPGYTGEVIDQNDIAVLRLSTALFDVEAYDLFDGDLARQRFTVAGYGGRSTIGGEFGVNARTGFLRQGENSYAYRWGDPAFGGFFTNVVDGENFFGTAQIDQSWVSDFDSRRPGNDAACLIAAAVGAPAGFGCGIGVGGNEVGVAGGDSGGPQFIDGRISSITSYGLTFGTDFGDCRAGLNSSCGEFSGYVPVNIHRDFIAAAQAVPEPSSWAMLIAGFGLVGAAKRRNRAAVLRADRRKPGRRVGAAATAA